MKRTFFSCLLGALAFTVNAQLEVRTDSCQIIVTDKSGQESIVTLEEVYANIIQQQQAAIRLRDEFEIAKTKLENAKRVLSLWYELQPKIEAAKLDCHD